LSIEAANHCTLEHAYRAHSDAIYRTCLRFAAGNREWAQDRVHEVFLKLAEKLDVLAEHDDLGGWLYRVAVNQCLMNIRRRKRWTRIAGMLRFLVPDNPSRPDAALQSASAASQLEEAVANLPANERSVITLLYFDDRQQSEVCEILGLSKGYVSKLHKRALERLKKAGWNGDDLG
jgi:RNA polymerase sigma-70 factor (ECF subfamily)